MYEELLTEIGLTKSEIAVYFALLELGSSTTGPIIKKAEISSGKAYLILDKLVLKGLVTHAIKSGTKHYQAKDPERLLDYLKEKESDLREKEVKLKEVVKSLKEKYEQEKYQPIAEVYEGVKAFKTFHEFILTVMHSGDTSYIYGAPRIANEKFSSYFVDWNIRRVKKKVNMKIIYNHDSREFGELRKKMQLTEVRYNKKHLETPVWVHVFKDYVATINVQGNPICFLLKNKEAAESYRKYFDVIWKQSNE